MCGLVYVSFDLAILRFPDQPPTSLGPRRDSIFEKPADLSSVTSKLIKYREAEVETSSTSNKRAKDLEALAMASSGLTGKV